MRTETRWGCASRNARVAGLQRMPLSNLWDAARKRNLAARRLRAQLNTWSAGGPRPACPAPQSLRYDRHRSRAGLHSLAPRRRLPFGAFGAGRLRANHGRLLWQSSGGCTGVHHSMSAAVTCSAPPRRAWRRDACIDFGWNVHDCRAISNRRSPSMSTSRRRWSCRTAAPPGRTRVERCACRTCPIAEPV